MAEADDALDIYQGDVPEESEGGAGNIDKLLSERSRKRVRYLRYMADARKHPVNRSSRTSD